MKIPVRKFQDALLLMLGAAFLLTLQASGRRRSATEKAMERQGLVDITQVDSTLHVSLMYTRADNFTGRVLYTDLHTAYLHPQAARALKRAQQCLRRKHPGLSLKVYDAARPMSIQQRMWNVVAGTEKDIYVSNPANGGGLHNYGMAVDITLCDAHGDSLTMGTRIDYMGPMAHVTNEEHFLRGGRLTEEAYRNRHILRRAMEEAGWRQLSTEWWHYNLVSRAVAKKKYAVIR